MAVIVNNPPRTSERSGSNSILGLIILLVVAYLLIVYGLPVLRSGLSTPQINIPGKIDINVNQPK